MDITTIILTYNEEIHIRRCLENVCSFSKRVIVVDSPSTDRTCEICREFPNVEVIVHPYPGNQAEQFNWALDNIEIETEWILRLDADEYLLPELVVELEKKVPALPEEVTGLEFKRRHIFMDKWVKHGIYPVIILRMFRKNMGRYDVRLMDEHISLKEGHSIVMDNDFCDHSLINISEYCRKHINYAHREAAEVLYETLDMKETVEDKQALGQQAQDKQKKKSTYNRLPLFWRSFAYFCYRYFWKRAFMDGKEGFLFTFLQGWWYRTLVDAKIFEIKKQCGVLGKKTISEEEKDKIRMVLKEQYGIKI